MNRIFLFVVTLLTFCFSSFSYGVEKSHTEAAEKLFQVMDMENAQKRTIEQLVAAYLERNICLKPYENILRDFLNKTVGFQNLKPDIIQIYVREFTEPELKELTAFYSSPVGKKVMEKLPILTGEGARIGQARVQANIEELKSRIKEAESKVDPATLPPECRKPQPMPSKTNGKPDSTGSDAK